MISFILISPKMLEISWLAFRQLRENWIFTHACNCVHREYLLTLFFSSKMAPADNNN